MKVASWLSLSRDDLCGRAPPHRYLEQLGADAEIKNAAGWKARDGIDGIKCPDSPDYHLAQIQQARTTTKLRDSLTNALVSCVTKCYTATT